MGKRAFAAGTAVLAAGVIAVGTGIASASTPAVRGAGTKTGVSIKTGMSTKTRATMRSRSEGSAAAPAVSTAARVSEGICSAPVAYKALAVKLSAGIQAELRGREGHHAVTMYDTVTKVSCHTDGTRHFDSASIVKAIILGALLRWHQETGTPLSAWEKDEATLMITESDNDAATALWDEVGMTRLQHFLNLAQMGETHLGQDGYWGLTQVTAHDEMTLLELLTLPNSVLSNSSRSYQLGLMSRVISSQRWGTPAGAPSDVTVHVKNGWLPDGTGWHINSIGAFTGKNKNYMIAVLTDDSPSEQYGIDTVEDVARVVHRDLNSSAASATLAASVAPRATAQAGPSPDALVAALPAAP
jgi:beta-lactamase class A